MTEPARVCIRIGSMVVAIAALAGGLVGSAQSQKFQAERDRLFEAAMAAQKARGIRDENDPQLQKYPAAVFQVVKTQKVLPGGSLSIALTGKIPAGTAILSDRDGAVVSGAALSATSYSASMAVGAAEGPGFVKLFAFTPVSHYMTSVPVAFIDAVYEFDLKSANGISIKATPKAKTFTIDAADMNATLAYQVDFFKPGDVKPFGTRVGTMSYPVGNDPRSRLDISMTEPPGAAEAEIEEINQKIGDPKLTGAQQQALMERMMKAQQRMMDDMMKAGKDPAAAQKKVDDFGCFMLQVYPGEAGAVRGMTVCGKNFNGGRVETTGTMVRVK